MRFSLVALLSISAASVSNGCLHHHGPNDFTLTDVMGHAKRNNGKAIADANADANANANTKDVEKQFLQIPSNNSASANLQYLTSRPHVAGTDGDVHMAYWLRNQMQRYGLSDSKVEVREVQESRRWRIDVG